MSDGMRVIVDGGPVPREAWLAFCAEHGLEHRPGILGGQVFQGGGVRADFAGPGGQVSRARPRTGDTPALAEASSEMVFSTFPGSPDLGRVDRLARAACARFGGRIGAHDRRP